MQPFSLFLGLISVSVWAANTVVCRYNMMQAFPPLLFLAIRMFITSVPLVFFVKHPKISPLLMAGIVLALLSHHGFGLFAYQSGLSAGATSLIMESQVFITILLGIYILKERTSIAIWVSLLIAFTGLSLVVHGSHTHMEIQWYAFPFAIFSAIAWAVNNIQIKLAKSAGAFSLVVWSSFWLSLTSFGASLILDGPTLIKSELSHLSEGTIWSLLYNGWASGLVAIGLWYYLLTKYDTQKVVPLSLLMPILSVVFGAIFLGEHVGLVMCLGGALVLLGVAIPEIPALKKRADALFNSLLDEDGKLK